MKSRASRMRRSKVILRSSLPILAIASSCANVYVTKAYSRPECFDYTASYLRSQGWDESREGANLIFRKGANIVPTLDYDTETLEVQVHLRQLPDNTFEVAVGNLGMAGEIHLLRNRFHRISSKLDEKISAECLSDDQ